MKLSVGALVALLLGGGGSLAQEEPARQDEEPKQQQRGESPQTAAAVGLKVDLLISRHDGERRISAVPYTLFVVPNSRQARVRLGIDVPIAVKDGEVRYRNVGTNVDCQAVWVGPGQYRLEVVVEQSSLYSPETSRKAVGPGASPAVGEQPVFRSFSSAIVLVLADGQSVQSLATDPVSGEVLKVDVTLSRVK
jgi:hypothetical protein